MTTGDSPPKMRPNNARPFGETPRPAPGRHAGRARTRGSEARVGVENLAGNGSPERAAGGAAGRVKPVVATDALILLGVPVLAGISWLLPERSWPLIARALGPLYAPAQGMGRRARRLHRLQAAFTPDRSTAWLGAALRELAAQDILSRIELLRDHRPGGWKPAIELSGREHLETAIKRGRGAILWIGHFVHANLVAKMAFHRAGAAVTHLSRPSHGFSSSRLGMRYLNRVVTAVEDRYLRARVLLSEDGSAAPALAVLEARLKDNGVVSISVRGTSRRPVAAPFLAGEISLAPGAPSLAHRSGAALLPVFPVRNEAGGFTVFVEPPLTVDRSIDRREASVAAIREYAGRLEPYVLAHPGQWMGWFRA